MAISKENVLIVYIASDPDSLLFKTKYQALHNITDVTQFLSISPSSLEILDNYNDFQTEVEDPIKSAIEAFSGNIFAIVLGPRIPGGFMEGNDVISSTSRLSRIFHSFEIRNRNPLYDRREFKRFDDSDAEIALIVTRFDLPSVLSVEDWLRKTDQASRTLSTKGTFYLDPYADLPGSEALKYRNDILFFSDTLLSKLGLPIFSTSFIDEYVDSIIPSLEDDSFVWSWGADRGSLSYFGSSGNPRIFFYNGDFDGARTMRDIDSTAWPLLATRSGYISTAGAMSDPGIDGFLRPYPFFNALLRGATLGEAMLFSTPYLDWTMVFFGDPLFTISFSLSSPTELVDSNVSWQIMHDYLARSAAHLLRKTNKLRSLRDETVYSLDYSQESDLLREFNILYGMFDESSWKNDYKNLVDSFIDFAIIRNRYNFPRFDPNLNDYLTQTSNKVSKITLDALQNPDAVSEIDSENLYSEGSWNFETILDHIPGTFAFYHFELDVATDLDFNDIILSKRSFDDNSSWTHETIDGMFVPVSVNGVTSNFAGKKIRYSNKNSELLVRATFYYFRFRQRDQNTQFTEYKVYKNIIFS